MNKQKFICDLKDGLKGFDENEIEEILNFYSEMIDDKIENGLTEEKAVEEIGSVDDVLKQILSEYSLMKLVKKRIKPKRKLTALEIVLLVLGSPIWVSVVIAILVALLSVVFSLYAVIWSVVISAWAIELSLVVSSIALILLTLLKMCDIGIFTVIAFLGVGLFCIGLSIFAFFGCMALTKATVKLTVKIVLLIKSLFVKGVKSND